MEKLWGSANILLLLNILSTDFSKHQSLVYNNYYSNVLVIIFYFLHFFYIYYFEFFCKKMFIICLCLFTYVFIHSFIQSLFIPVCTFRYLFYSLFYNPILMLFILLIKFCIFGCWELFQESSGVFWHTLIFLLLLFNLFWFKDFLTFWN